MNDDKKRLKELYTNLKADNYDLPEYGTFESDMADEGLMRQLYDNMKSDNYDLPDFNTFRGDMGYGSYQEPKQVEKAQPQTAVYNPATYAPTVQKQPHDEGVRAPFADAESTRAYDERRKKDNFARSSEELGKMAESLERQSEGMGQRVDAAQEAVRRGTTPGQTHGKEIDPVTGQMRDVWYTQSGEKVATPMEQTIANNPNPLTEEERQALMEANRKQVEDLTKSIDEGINSRTLELQELQKRNFDLPETITYKGKEYKTGDDGFFTLSPELLYNYELEQVRSGKSTSAFIPSRNIRHVLDSDDDMKNYRASKRAMENAQRLISEADHNAKEGKFESSFVAGLGRGFGQKISDPSTWDMGVSDLMDNRAIFDALNAWEAGKELTPSQQALLDAKVVELATIEYFSNQVGHGYKAGGVTAESMPLMVEMIFSPLSGAGKGAAKVMAKYALKRFGRSVMKKGLKRGLVTGASFLGHEGGTLASGIGMTLTTGAARTEADALRRMTGTPTGSYDENGELHFDDVDNSGVVDEKTARRQAMTAQTISYMSEMFIPEGGNFAKRMLGIAAKSKTGKYTGLRAVNSFFTKAGKSKIGRTITDLERRAQWHGAPEEFIEEIADGLANAKFVGDQSIRGKDGKIFGTSDPDAIFNQENLIDTGLGVGVMSLAFPFARTMGYGLEKGVMPSVESYRYKRKLKKTLSAADREGEQAFGDVWGTLRNTLSFGTEDEVNEAVRNVLASEEYSDEQKKAAIRYAVVAQGKHLVDDMMDQARQDPVVANTEDNFDAGYEDMTEPQQRRDANIMLADARKTLADIVGEDVMGVIEEDPYGMDVQMQNDQTVSDDVKEAVANYASARAAVDGINQRIEDDADDKSEKAREEHSEMVHKDAEGNPDGSVHPVKMKDKDENGNPREGYIVDGNIVMRSDGTVDEEASDSQVVVYYPATGERKPVALDDIAEYGDVVTGEAFEQQLEEVRAADVQSVKDAAAGRIQEGMELALPDGRPSVILEIGTEGVKLLNPDDAGKPFNEQRPIVVSVEEAQGMADAWAVAKYKATHPDTAPAQNGNATAAPNPTRKGHKQIERAKKDLAEAEDTLVKANAIQNFWTNVDAGAEATEEEKALFDNAKKELEAEGYEIVDMVGKPYFEGTKAISNFVVDESLPTGTKVVRRVIKPQVNKDGKVVQIAELQVAKSLFDDEAEVNEAIEAARGGNADAQATLDRMGIEWREAETAPAEGAEVSDAASTYADLTAKYGEKAGHKIEVTVNDRVADMEKAKKALQTAQAKYDDAPIGKEEKAEEALAKAQEAYDAAREEWLKWDAVMSEHTAAVAKSKAEAVTHRMDNLGVAREMESSGKDAKAVKMATGWERGADGKWRYEIQDFDRFDPTGNVEWMKRHPEAQRYRDLNKKRNAAALGEGEPLTEAEQQEFDKLNNEYKHYDFNATQKNKDNLTLQDYVEADELFKAYPELKDVGVEVVMDRKHFGEYRDRDKEIIVHAENPREAEEVLAHEVQHAIQHIEGFAKGGNLKSAKNLIDSTDSYREDKEKFVSAVESYDEVKDTLRPDYTLDVYIRNLADSGEFSDFYGDLLKQHSAEGLRKQYERIKEELKQLPAKTAEQVYNAMAGEVEARNAARRRNMTAEERRASLAEETEDVARKDQIFLFGNGGESAMAEPTEPAPYKAPERRKGESVLEYARRVSESYRAYQERANAGNGGDGETDDIWQDRTIGMEEKMTAAAARLASNHEGDAERKTAAMRAVGGNLASLRRAMRLQKEFDKGTVKRVTDLARILVQEGYLDNMRKGEVKRLLSAVKNATGKEDITANVNTIMDIMVDSQLRKAEESLSRLMHIRGSKVDARGVEVQGQLDVEGQEVMKVFKDAHKWSEDEIAEAMGEAENRMTSDNATVAEAALREYTGLRLALEYARNIAESEREEQRLRSEKNTALLEVSDDERGSNAFREYLDSVDDAIRQNKIERAVDYQNLVGMIYGGLKASMENAQAFNDAEKERVREIQHNANSDMEGRPSNEHYKPKFLDKFVNNSLVQFLFSPLSTFEQMLRMFGSKSTNGEGYLYNRFVRGWVDSREKEIRGVREKYARLDEKVRELFGKDAKNMGELIRKIGNMPKMNVEFWDGGKMRPHQLTQGNLLYIYMVDKMEDGRMKLRKMGIDEKAVNRIMREIDPRLMELADWMQDEFLVDTRNEYNETHKRIFGAPMAAIENYFPLKVNANARVDKAEDLDNPGADENTISTKTGSIIKRRRNTLSLDLLNADALNVVLDHVAQMEHWNAYAEFNRDLNTLRTYKRFRNHVKNMTTIYGSGEKLWEKFNDLAQMAAGTYRPKRANLDAAAVNVAKGVTAAKVSFRIFTALKQFLSMPAYIPDARPDLWAKNIATPWKAWGWAMENLPIFEERWKSRMAGDPRLLKSELDWKGWRNNIVQIASRIGMSPNAFVDALTVSIGARTIYETRKARYLKEGYSEEQADKRAKQDAEVAYNQTQQSSEGAFLSTMQVDRSWLSVMFTVFRNASMAYQRQLHDALRNLKRDMKKGNRSDSVEFMAKQMEREGVDADKALKAAKARYDRQVGKDVLRVATFGFVLQFCWNLGSKLPYLLFGDDDDKKKEMMDDVFAQSMFGWAEGLTGGDMFSQAGKMAVQGEGNPEYLKKEMPVTSDVYDILQKIGNGKYGEVLNDVVNLAVQVGIGVNPQSITDGVLAVMDYCGDDPKLAREGLILAMRILQVPQSQIRDIYFDEIGMSGEEASKLTPEQLVERYAEYQVKRGRMIEPWSWDDETAIDKEISKAKRQVNERAEKIGDDAVNEAYGKIANEMKEMEEKDKAYNKAKREHDMIEAAKIRDDISKDEEAYIRYRTFKAKDKRLDKAVEDYMKSNTTEEAQKNKKAIEDIKAEMVNTLNNK